MKSDTHPQYYPQAKVKCACGHKWTTGSTVPELEVEICSNCHPFYTGNEKVLDTRGRIDKFKKRITKAQEKIQTSPAKKTRKTNKK